MNSLINLKVAQSTDYVQEPPIEKNYDARVYKI